MSAVYNFQLFDGVISTRDITMKFDINSTGVIFDVCRTAVSKIDYNTLECIKNGYLATGKYHSMKLVFDSKPVIVFANNTPDTSRLSSDRWQIFTIGIDDGFHHSRSEIPDFVPQEERPSIPPPQIPDLTQNFSLRNYLIEKGFMAGSYSYVYLFMHINMYFFLICKHAL